MDRFARITSTTEVDFFSVHPYSIYAPKLFPDAMLSERGTYGSAFETALSGGAGRPVMVQEIGASSAQYDPGSDREISSNQPLLRARRRGKRISPLWCYTDAAPAQFHKVPLPACSTRNSIRTYDLGWKRARFGDPFPD